MKQLDFYGAGSEEESPEKHEKRAKANREAIAPYCLSENWEEWLSFAETGFSRDWSDRQKVRFITARVPSPLKERLIKLKDARLTYPRFRERARDKIKAQPDKEVQDQVLETLEKQPSESELEFYNRLREAWNDTSNNSETDLFKIFKRAIKGQGLARLTEMGLKSHEQIKARARDIGRWGPLIEAERKQAPVILAAQSRSREQQIPLTLRNEAQKCYYCGQTGHVVRYCILKRREEAQDRWRTEAKAEEIRGMEAKKKDNKDNDEPQWTRELKKCCSDLVKSQQQLIEKIKDTSPPATLLTPVHPTLQQPLQ